MITKRLALYLAGGMLRDAGFGAVAIGRAWLALEAREPADTGCRPPRSRRYDEEPVTEFDDDRPAAASSWRNRIEPGVAGK